MLRARMNTGAIILGLEPADVDHITGEGQPIMFSLDDIGYPIQVIVFYGLNEQDMLETLKKHGIEYAS